MTLSQSVYFDKGQPHGKYWRGNVTSPVSAEVQLDHGYLIDTAYYYFAEGTIKAKVAHTLQDKVYFAPGYQENLKSHAQLLEKLSDYSELERNLIAQPAYENGTSLLDEDKLIGFNANRTGDYIMYYKNGVVASKGRVESGSKVGTWKYWDLSGGLFKQVQHDSGWFVNPITQDSFRYFGTVDMWYPNGQKLLSGLILSRFERFKCDQEMEVDFENLYYLSHFDKDGKETLIAQGGKVNEYHNNSEKRLDGEMEDGKRTGIWRFYDPNGNLEETGRYVNGLRTGLWISGDLEAVPYYEDMCVKGEVDAYKFPDPMKTGKVTQDITIHETLWEAGIFIQQNGIKLRPLY